MKMTVLVIDDDQAVRRFLRTVPSGQGHCIVEVGSVAEGIDQLRRARPDVVLLDLGPPDPSERRSRRRARAGPRARRTARPPSPERQVLPGQDVAGARARAHHQHAGVTAVGEAK